MPFIDSLHPVSNCLTLPIISRESCLSVLAERLAHKELRGCQDETADNDRSPTPGAQKGQAVRAAKHKKLGNPDHNEALASRAPTAQLPGFVTETVSDAGTGNLPDCHQEEQDFAP